MISSWGTLQVCPVLRREGTVLSSILSRFCSLPRRRTRHTCHPENSPLGYRMRAQMLHDFLLLARDKSGDTEGRPHSRGNAKREHLGHNSFLRFVTLPCQGGHELWLEKMPCKDDALKGLNGLLRRTRAGRKFISNIYKPFIETLLILLQGA